MNDVMFYIVGQIQIQTRSLRCSELFNVTRRVAPLNCAPGATSAVADCLVEVLVGAAANKSPPPVIFLVKS